METNDGDHDAGEQPANPSRTFTVEIRCGQIKAVLVGETDAKEEKIARFILELTTWINEFGPPPQACKCAQCKVREGQRSRETSHG